MVLDGQQRITSIYYALTAPDQPLDNTKWPQRFGLKFSRVLDGKLDDQTVQWKSSHYGIWDDLSRDDYKTQIEKDFIPFTIFKSKDTYDDWRFGMADYAMESDRVSRNDIQVFDKQTRVFRNYGIPIIEMGSDTSSSTVVQTFERINTQGLELGIFDILTARLYPEGVRLRDLWDQTYAGCENIQDFAISTDVKRIRKHLLKALALYRDRESKDEVIGDLSANGFANDWQTVSEMVDRALDKAQSTSAGGLGVTEKYGFPYSTLLPPLANLLHLAENAEAYPRHKNLDMVQRWYWASTFSRRYSGSSDTLATKDYTEGRDWMRGDRIQPPEAVQDAPNMIPVEMDLETLTQGGPYTGVMSLIALNGAQDFGTFEGIDLHEVDDHHIFPDAKLKQGATGQEYSTTARNRVLNRTIIESKNNRFNIRDRLPSEYVPDMVSAHPEGEEGVRELLRGHCIDADGFEALLDDHYERFCDARKSVIRGEIEDRVGAEIAWSVTESRM